MTPPDLGKTEAWVILAAEPRSKIYAGLRPGVDREQLAAAIAEGTCERLLHHFQPRPGDCLFIPAGTVHALGDGLLVAEIQQSSDTTFRLFDWNRAGADGQPRALHVEQGLAVVDFQRGPIAPQQPRPTDRPVGKPPGGVRQVRDRPLGFRPAANDRRRPAVPHRMRLGGRGSHRRRPARGPIADGKLGALAGLSGRR